MKKTILITGGAGMIAWSLIQKIQHFFNKQYHIVALDYADLTSSKQYYKERVNSIISQGITYIHYDLLSDTHLNEILITYNPFIVIHLAANSGITESFLYPEKVLKNNQNTFLHLIESIRLFNHNIPIIYASSSSIYGNNINLPCNP